MWALGDTCCKSQLNQIDLFRRSGLGNFRQLLVELSQDPAMIIWLDNNDNHKGAINENYGRELLELFSMGIGNYTEHPAVVVHDPTVDQRVVFCNLGNTNLHAFTLLGQRVDLRERPVQPRA